MKTTIALFSFLVLSFSAFSATVHSTKKGTAIQAARVVELVKLVNKDDIKVSIVVQDNGGSTDVSPTQKLFFTLYVKGERFSTDATFDLGYIYELKSAKRISGGVYEIRVSAPNEESSMPEDQILMVDAQKAIISIKAVDCEDFGCAESTDFKASITVNKI